MLSMRRIAVIAATTALAAACSPADDQPEQGPSPTENVAATAAVDHTDPLASAMSAAPAAVSSAATIVTMDADGTMTTLREGSNGFTCMGDNPATPGPDPMCMDANAMEWAMAWIGHTPPPMEKAGVMYMLAGGTDASNTDPYATGPSEGGEWIETGPHMMVVGSQAALTGYPGGDVPDTSAPYVMWAGTPYAHLMIPVE
jgi:hypothetical protein